MPRGLAVLGSSSPASRPPIVAAAVRRAGSAQLRDDLGGEELDVVEVGHGREPAGTPAARRPRRTARACRRSRRACRQRGVAAQFVDLAADGGGPAGDLGVVATRRRRRTPPSTSASRVPGPPSSTAAATRPYCALRVSTSTNGMLNSEANFAVSAGVRLGPPPPMMIGGCGVCTGLGSAGEFLIGVVRARVVERLARRACPTCR